MSTVYFDLAGGNFFQDWSNIGQITANDDWSGVPSIVGYLGDINASTITNTDARTLTGANLGAVDVIANAASVTITNGGVAEFHIADPVVGFQGSGTADAPSLVLYLNATGRQDLHLELDLRRLDVDVATQQFNIQYRLADGADWINVPGGYVANAANSHISLDLPAELNGQATVQVRLMTVDATGSDAFIGMDNISVTSQALAATTVSITDASITEGDDGTQNLTFTVTRSDTTGDFEVTFTTADGTAAGGSDFVPTSGTVLFTAGGPATQTISVPINGDTDIEGDETFVVNLIAATGGVTIGDNQATGTILNDDVAATHFFQADFTGFTAGGFSPTPSAGQLDSDIWVVTGFSDGANPAFGFTGAAGTDFGRGVISGDPTSAGIYATPAATPTFGAALLYQPTGGEGDADGSIVARVQNTTGDPLTNFTVSFDWVFRNTGDRSSALVFEFSTDGTNWTVVNDAAFTTPATNTGQAVLSDSNVGLTLTGLALNPDEFLFLRWRHDFSTGGGNRDEFGIDNVTVDADVPAGPVVSITDASIAEGDAGTQIISFTVKRAGATDAFSVDFTTADGSATAGSDYVATSGTLTFAAGEVSKTVTVEVNGDITVENIETFFVNLVNPTGGAIIADGQGAGTITNDDVSLVAIHDIQGASHTSPLNGAHVTTSGIVTAIDTTGARGFWIQDPNPDADDATSEAIFVFTGSIPTVSVGDLVRVEGDVNEFSGSDPNNLSITEIDSPIVTVISSGNALPAATVLGSGGRLVPTEVIDNDDFAVFDPAQDAVDFYESLEGMRVTVPDAQATGPTNGNSTWVVANQGANATGMNPAGGITISAGDFNPERVQVFFDSGVAPASVRPNAGTGDDLGDITGIMHYFGGDYEVLPTAIGSTGSGGALLPKETTALSGDADHITVGALNVENLDPTDPQAKFDALAANIVGNLGAPDILGLEEVQDADGAGNGTNFSGQPTAQKLIDSIVAAGGPTYIYVEVAPTANNQNGGENNGNIRNGFLYNPDRVGFVSVSQILDTTPANGDTYANSRKPLVGEFTFRGETITLIGVHNTSRLGSDALFGQSQPAINAGDDRRIEQTLHIKTFVEGLVASDPDARVIVLGDFNAFQFETSLTQLESGGALTNLTSLLPASDRYSFNFDGNDQQLDHMLASPELAAGAQFDIVHINSNQAPANQTSDHDGSVARFFVNFDPVAAADSATVTEDQSVTIDVLANDTDPNAGDTKTLVSVSATAKGASVAIVDGRIVYTADVDAFDPLGPGDSATDTFSYVMQDARGVTSTATVTVEVVGAPNGPTQNGGNGADSLTGAAADDVLNGANGSDTLSGGEGADTVSGGGGADNLFGGAGIDSLSGANGADTLSGGAGDDVASGGQGPDVFSFEGAFGDDVISDFNPIDDTIRFVGAGFVDFADVMANAAQVGANVVITNAGGDSLQLNNVQLASLTSADFLFP